MFKKSFKKLLKLKVSKTILKIDCILGANMKTLSSKYQKLIFIFKIYIYIFNHNICSKYDSSIAKLTKILVQ